MKNIERVNSNFIKARKGNRKGDMNAWECFGACGGLRSMNRQNRVCKDVARMALGNLILEASSTSFSGICSKCSL